MGNRMTLHHRNNSGGERWEQWGENPVPTTPIPLSGGGGGNGGVRGGVSASGEVLTLRHFKNAGGALSQVVALLAVSQDSNAENGGNAA